MQYLLMLYVDEQGFSRLSQAQRAEGVAAYSAYTKALEQAGVLVTSARLGASAAATTVRMRDGKAQVLDGPYAESKEQLGGALLIEVPDLDQALAWARRCPAASHGVVEVRPIWSPS